MTRAGRVLFPGVLAASILLGVSSFLDGGSAGLDRAAVEDEDERETYLHLVAETHGDSTLARRVPLEARAPSISGRVIDSRGRPVADAFVFPIFTRTAGGWSRDPLRSPARTRSDGSFRLADFEEAPPSIGVLHPGFAFQEVRDVASAEAGLEIVLGARSQVEGIVLDATTRRPIERFRAELRSAENPEKAYPFGFDVAEPDPARPGRFAYEGFAPGRYCLEVAAEGYGTAWAIDIEAEEGERGANVEVLLERAAAVRGLVLDRETGRAVPGASVGLAPTRTCKAFFARDRTDASGRFELADLAPGRARLRVESPLHLPLESDTIDLLPEGTVAGIVLALSGKGTIEGCATGPSGSRILRGRAYLRRVGVPGVRGCQFDARGAFRFEGLDPGAYEVEAILLDARGRAVDGESPRARVALATGETKSIALRAP